MRDSKLRYRRLEGISRTQGEHAAVWHPQLWHGIGQWRWTPLLVLGSWPIAPHPALPALVQQQSDSADERAYRLGAGGSVGTMAVEWLGWFKALSSSLSGAKSLYDRVSGKQPTLDFIVGQNGVDVIINNARGETTIIERIDASPPLLGFTAGQKLHDVVEAVVRQRQIPAEDALAVIGAGKEARIGLMTFDPFDNTDPKTRIKVTMHWRSVTRSWFSPNRVVRREITVRDVRDLRRDSDKRRLRGQRT